MFQESGDTTTAAAELVSLAEASPTGMLTPAEVVNFAEEHPLSALHKKFEWNNTKAAHCYRLWQARQLIASVVMRRANKEAKPVRVFVHLRDDKEGYRATQAVCADKDMFSRLDAQFRRDIKSLRNRYDCLKKYHHKLFGEIDDL